MNKIAHTLILAVFGIACWFLRGLLFLASQVNMHHGVMPAFSRLCIGLRPVMVILPVLAAAYCLWIWFRRAERLPSWVTFFAATMSLLVLITLPTLVAAYLPLVVFTENQVRG